MRTHSSLKLVLIGFLFITALSMSTALAALDRDPAYGNRAAGNPIPDSGCLPTISVTFDLVSQDDGTCTLAGTNSPCRFIGTATATAPTSPAQVFWVCMVDTGSSVNAECWKSKRKIKLDSDNEPIPVDFAIETQLPCGDCDLVVGDPE
jgi:hypothetical protein